MHFTRRPLRLVLLAVVALLSLPAVASADSSTVDTSYGSGGFASPWPGGQNGGTRDFTNSVDPQGRLVVAGTAPFFNGSYTTGSAFLGRFLPNGQLDTTFANGGEWTPGIEARAPSIAGTADGSTIVATAVWGGNYWSPAVWCVSPTGGTCPNFTSGSALALQNGTSSVGIVPDGDPALGNYIYIAVSQPSGGFQIERLHPNGALDTAYGSGGITSLPGSGTPELAVYPDGSLVVSAGGATGAVLSRLAPDGLIDTRWGTSGTVTISSGAKAYDGSVLTLLPTGEVVAAVGEAVGTVNGYTVARLSVLGQPEVYGTGGQTIIPVTTAGSGINATLNNIVARPDGGVLLAGTYGTNSPVIVSVDPTGNPDTSFNGTGIKVIGNLAPGSIALPAGTTQPLLVGDQSIPVWWWSDNGASAIRLAGSASWGTAINNPSLLGGTRNGNNATVGDPVNTATGNVYTQAQDLQLAGRGPGAIWLRGYNSQDPQAGPFGYGWVADFGAVLRANPDGSVTERDPQGAQLKFTLSGGIYSAPAGVRDDATTSSRMPTVRTR